MGTYRLDKLFNPASVAVVGASPRAGSLGGLVLKALRSGGYGGRLDAVNPGYDAVDGVACAPSLTRLDAPTDLAIIVAPPQAVESVIRDAVSAQAKAAIILTAGLGGGPGSVAEDVHAIARTSGLRLLGPNCLGLLSPRARLNASFAARMPQPGPLALISQSGAIAAGMVEWAAGRGVGFSGIVSIGDALDVDAADCLDWFAEDAATTAILLYLEDVKDARKFMSAARKAARVKPLIAIKAGRHAAGARAAATHTGALAGSDAVYDAALRRAGALRVFDLDELFATARTLAVRPTFAGARIAVLTNGGGLGVLAVDRLEDLGGTLAALAPATITALDAFLPPTWSRANPVDIIGDAPPERYARALEHLMADPGIDAVLALNCPTAVAPGSAAADAVIRAFADAGQKARKPLFAVWLGADSSLHRRFEAAGIASFESESDAVRAIMDLVHCRGVADSLVAAIPVDPPRIVPDRSKAAAAIAAALRDGRSWLSPLEAQDLVSAYGIASTPVAAAASPAEARAAAAPFLADGAACVVKIQSRDIVHKSDVDGVRLGLKSEDAVELAARDILARAATLRPDARLDGVTIQPMISRPHARELIVGVAVDPTFGPVILFGHGGTAVEVIDDKAMELLPISQTQARNMVARTRVARLLAGYRTVPAVHQGKLAELLVRVSRLIEDNPEIVGLDLNPVLADENDALALDLRVQVAPRPAGEAADRRFAVRPYPVTLESEVNLADGARLQLRPIRPSDADGVMAMLRQCSERDLRLRFLSAMKEPDPRLIARLAQIDYAREMAFVAVEPASGDILGVARLHGDADHARAEHAIIVRSDWQGRGLGYALMERLIAFARAEGYREIWAVEMAENDAMLSMGRHFGFARRDGRFDAGEVEVFLTLAAEGQVL
jgi:acetyltransferase